MDHPPFLFLDDVSGPEFGFNCYAAGMTFA
jgi:hypothetical protein